MKDNYDRIYSALTREFLNGCCSDGSRQNVVISPLSILILLSMLAGSVAGDTRDEVLRVIGDGADYADVREKVRELSALMKDGRKTRIVNAVCVNEKIGDTVRPEYVDALKKFYSGELLCSSDIVRDVNRWIRDTTDGMIGDVLDESAKDMLACLINAVAFESKWETAYEEDQIWVEDFRNADGSKTPVPMLNSDEDRYIESGSYTGFVKEYKGRKYSFMGLLPRKRGAAQIRKCLEEIDFTETFESAEECDVRVTIPEFGYTCKYDLSECCSRMGIKKAFTDKADFSPMSSEWLKVEQILHSARIELDRSGTKAAAVTLSVLFAGFALDFREPKIVKLDRPFIYAVMHNETKLPVFVGVVNQLQL